MDIRLKDIIEEINKNKKYDSYGCDICELVSDQTFDKFDFDEIHTESTEGSRWSIGKYVVTKITDKENKEVVGYIESSWDHPATEMQEGQDTNLEVYEVVPKKKTIITYVRP